ncbi:hypothetical protein AB0D08_18905 [Kitasatospora sp. NPDC048540]|uniref:mevalonate kinase family protein n=1 Tax=unclassified Kitasatospora TaxID=2633591 RepID=UPI00053B245E|nr:hypothetical protein [Kitasatospora sp. MBT63]
MTGTRVFAPGKLMIVGEYAVLHGGRSLVTAVSSGIECRSVPRAGGWWLTAPDLGIDAPLSAVWRAKGGRLLAAAVTAGAEAFALTGPRHLTVRGVGTGAGRKTGLGGSAAGTVAVLGCLGAVTGLDLAGADVRRRIFDLAFAVHRAHQGGHGSGADVAASVYGGWVDYSLFQGVARIRPAAVPPGLLLAAAWSGVTADTRESLAEFEMIPSAPAILERMHAVLADFWAAADASCAPALLRSVSGYGGILHDVACELGVPARARIAELVSGAARDGVAVKGSGAVGGDCVIALGTGPGRLDAVRSVWRKLGAKTLDLTSDHGGMRLVDLHG